MLSANKHNFPNGIPECGTDGLRLSLLTHDIQDQRINIDVKSIQEVLNLNENNMDRWILSRLARLVAVSNTHFEAFNFHLTADAVRKFWVQNFCDIYLEYAKPALLESQERRLLVCRIMLTCIETFLKIISPMMPFLSEELYQRLFFMSNIEHHPSISLAKYPTADKYLGWRNAVLEADVLTVTDIISITRSLKSKHGVTRMKPAVVIAVEEENALEAMNPFSNLMVLLAKLESVTFHLTQGQEFFEQYPQDSWVFEKWDHGITVIMDIGEKPKPRKAIMVLKRWIKFDRICQS
ncbi:valine--tRNA ligase, mitochondrial [Caerostris extrusa]|uniref:valine--tRNA ligase n=1 Tax=Caerostris extrusa TaxID=172846 RepID=A0AAV4WJA0_CAEEX|nr:valine--tRNA ligase, mitochondrial [Caerostris extrusa]